MEPLTESEINAIGLPKWPQIVVVGEPIARERALEILVRTSGLYFGCNDREWEEFCLAAFGMPSNQAREGWPILDNGTPEGKKAFNEALDAYFDEGRKARERFGVLELEYLTNHQIASSYIGGPYGWLSWDGLIGCHEFNIGKWPSANEVFKEWSMIAIEWPFLRLRCQLFNAEQCEEGGVPLIEYKICEGKVTAHRAEAPLVSVLTGVKYHDTADAVKAIMYDRARERGCSPQVLLEAIKVTKEALARKVTKGAAEWITK
jgi:hypothetical protein